MVLGSDLIRWGRPRRRGTALAAALLLFLAPALAACSDDEGGGSQSATPVPTLDTPTVIPSVSEPEAQPRPSDPKAAEAEIRANWQKFFDPKTPLKDKQAVLENGEQMAPVLQAFNGDERGGKVGAQVEKVVFTSPTGANVTYTLTLSGQTALPNASGTAVEQDGTWKVSVNTLCALVQLSRTGSASQSPIPGC
ncbi:hypothetical protein RKD23_005938 [Streptomyces sp. SAI-170]|uniref:hypothetical protein n=1 Tax=Streptomyces sp. SAI-170 TaxID=3377729 RepID=UPI003C79D6D2